MLSISQTSNYYYCLEWIPSESGLEVLKFDKIKFNHNLGDKDSIHSIIEIFNPISKDDSNSLSLSIDIDNIQISSIKLDSKISIETYINWYEKNILGRQFLDNFYNYYYPFGENNLMMINIDKIFKKNIVDSVSSSGYNLIDFNLGILSANYSVKQIMKIKNLKNYLIWKIGKNKIHYLTYYKDGNFSCMVKLKKTKNNIKELKLVGDPIDYNQVVDFLKSVLIDNSSKSDFCEKVLVYQCSNDKKNIESILDENIEVINISSFFDDSDDNKFKFLNYVENSNSLKGIDV